uniref:Uncharacterized protein n=1 Tax=Fagus sylvatica TaxID=28930 RepID=A0A2N9I7V2_FAGSY
MEDNHVAFEDHEATTTTTNTHSNNDHGWQKDSADRRRRILEAQRSAAVDSDVVSRSKHRINNDDDGSDGEGDRVAENGKAEESKKVKAKKPKKPKVTVSDAAAKIDADDLSAFLADITASYQRAAGDTADEIRRLFWSHIFGGECGVVSVGEDVQRSPRWRNSPM